MDIIDPPAASETDQRKSRSVFPFIGPAKMDFKSCTRPGLRQLSGAHYLAVKHPPMRDDQFVPYIEGDLLAVSSGEHVVSRTELAAIQRQELGANDFPRAGRENAEGRIQTNENPRREYKGGQREGKQQEEIVAQVAPSRRLFHAGRAGLLRRPFRRNSGNESYG